ncbi:ATP-binding protein [Actinoplanes sp. NPDC023936]|uniref:AAA family ATPase n=1 Tax=Actinoplanes sp. NPDC023936 TaxID=3154910 RepID=UPI0033D94FFB
MLRSFRAGNHKSLRDEQELLLMPSYQKDQSALPVTAVFGANASGKSNVLDALAWMCGAVRESFQSWEPGVRVPREPYRFDEEAIAAPSIFVVEVLVGTVRYVYGFTVSDDRVLDEWLFTYPKGRKRVIFEREGESWTFGSTVPRARFEAARDLTRGNALFLSVAARSDLTEVLPVYHWFADSVRFESPQARLQPDVRMVVSHLRRSSESRRGFLDLVRLADLGIRDIEVHEGRRVVPNATSYGSGSGTLVLPDYELFFRQGAGTPLLLADQSHGTVAWLRILSAALDSLETGRLLCIDELDSSLHPRLTARLIELFRHPETNPRGAQLVFTTHDATLLGTSFGDDVLNRDEIWFTEKDSSGATTLFPLTDFHPRKGGNLERQYLGGSYGAVPAVFSDTLVDALLTSGGEGSDEPS